MAAVPTPSGAGPSRSAAAEAAAQAALNRAASSAAPPYTATPMMGERSGGGVRVGRTPAQERLHEARMLQLRRGINDPLPRAHLIETDATDELILHASKDDDPSTISHPPPPPRYPNLDEEHPAPEDLLPEPMEVEGAAAAESDSASQDSDSRAARARRREEDIPATTHLHPPAQSSSARRAASSERRSDSRTRHRTPISGNRVERQDGVDLNETDPHPYPPVDPPPFDPARYGLPREADTPEARALVRAAEDRQRIHH